LPVTPCLSPHFPGYIENVSQGDLSDALIKRDYYACRNGKSGVAFTSVKGHVVLIKDSPSFAISGKPAFRPSWLPV
jgi:hypothetical protein